MLPFLIWPRLTASGQPSNGTLARSSQLSTWLADRGRNPEVPAWLKEGYFKAIQDLASVAYMEIQNATDREAVRAILSVIALAITPDFFWNIQMRNCSKLKDAPM
jgi:hypothetical protein